MNVEPERGRYCVIISVKSTTLSKTKPDPLALKCSTAKSSSCTIWSVSKSCADETSWGCEEKWPVTCWVQSSSSLVKAALVRTMTRILL